MVQNAAARVMDLAAHPFPGLKHPWNLKTYLLADWIHASITYPAALDPVEAVIAFTDAVPENGCMRYLPDMHRQAKIKHVEMYARNRLLTRGQEIVQEIGEEQAAPASGWPCDIWQHMCARRRARRCRRF